MLPFCYYHIIFDEKSMNFMWLDVIAAVLIILMLKNHKSDSF